MTLHLHYAVSALANTYLIAADDATEAALIDPVVLDVQLFNLIEENGYDVRHLLFTEPSRVNAQGIETINKVFDVVMYAPAGTSLSHGCTHIAPGDEISLNGEPIRVVDARDAQARGVLYETAGVLFSGTWLGAGIISTTAPEEVRTARRYEILDSLADYPDCTPIFPYHGPPSTLGVERQSSPAFTDYTP